MCLADDYKLDEADYVWFVQKRTQDMPVSELILCVKAAQLHTLLHEGGSEPPFQASVRNLEAAKRFANLKQLTLDFCCIILEVNIIHECL